MDLRHPYLTEQLIAYIGNKRALLPFLHGVLAELVPDPSRASFLDPFAGSGAVSRLARLMGFSVAASDREMYSYIINTCHLGTSAAELECLFAARGGIDAVLSELNALPPLPEDLTYISRHYAPRSTAAADWRTERLFYTRENALVIDSIRQRIEEMYPSTAGAGEVPREKAILLAPLLYQAATHTNTSGVFKACHRGFGGHGRDALSRIMAPIRLKRPILVDAPAASAVTCADARVFLGGRSADICYLDPPYAGHQYGSNYFMLNSIALWDRLPVSTERGADGRLVEKAGIRADWVRTRSAFCGVDTAPTAMRETVRAADCRWLVVSYSDEGIIGLEELCDLLAAEGALSLRSTGYVKYPGGRQSLTRSIRNRELALVVDRRSSAGSPPARRLLRDVRIARLMGGSFHPVRVRASFTVHGGAIILEGGQRIPMRHLWRFSPEAPVPRFAAQAAADRFQAALTHCLVRDAREEIGVLARIAGRVPAGAESDQLLREILRLLNRLAHRKYRVQFESTLGLLRSAGRTASLPEFFLAGLERIADKAKLRAEAGRPVQ